MPAEFTRRAVITGLGFVTSIGNSRAEVLDSLRHSRTGIELFPPFSDPRIPVKLAGTIKGFNFPSVDQEGWDFPGKEQFSRVELRTMTPNTVFALTAMREAIGDAALAPEAVSHPLTGLYCASGGSMWMQHAGISKMIERGPQRMLPATLITGIPNSLHINLVARFKIKGSSLGFSSACASSAHALGVALDDIRLGRQDVAFAVGAEDCDFHTMAPFAGLRALSPQADPERFPCPFDAKRDGFIGTGGAAVLVVEELRHAEARGAKIYAELLGWGQASDGFDVVLPEPSGDGLARAMRLAMAEAGLVPEEVDYINAHATGTTAGDLSEIRAIQQVFGAEVPHISSTKALTGHGLSLAGAMEAGFCCLAIKEAFTPVSAHVTEIDPAFAEMPIVTHPISDAPRVAMSNSSGFGGSNVSLIFRQLL